MFSLLKQVKKWHTAAGMPGSAILTVLMACIMCIEPMQYCNSYTNVNEI